jgi:hypothetical protein
MGVNWNGKAWLEAQTAIYTERVNSAAEFLRGEMRVMIGIQGPPQSKPGEPPHIDTGNLIHSLGIIPGQDGSYIFSDVGTDVEYGIFLELGTANMAARPWCLRSLRESDERIRQILEHGGTYDVAVG